MNAKKKLDYLPTFLQVASLKIGLLLAECRNKFGLFTVGQWIELLNTPPRKKNNISKND